MPVKGMPMPATTDFPVSMRALLTGAWGKQPALLDLIQQLVRAESPTDDPAAVSACAALAAAHARMLGGQVKLHRQRGFGDAVEARFGPKSKIGAAGRTLLLGHLDTVWPLGTLQVMPCRVRQGRLWGPGALDMKAGVAMALTAIEILTEASLLNREIVLLLNGDEEVGSPASRSTTERLAAECAQVFVLEPAQGMAYKTARKGTGRWRIEVTGVAAHAGVDFEKGASAIRELARVVEKVSGWTDLKRGLTVNVGVAGGGSKTNVIAAEAWAEVDVRILRSADGVRIARKFAALKPKDKQCALAVSGSIGRPPMERARGTIILYRQARALASKLGFSLEEALSGGASDGNFTSALGIPTLDGMGAVGEGAHAHNESIVVEHLAPRTALLAGMLARCFPDGTPDTLPSGTTRSSKTR
jgi:glutamate carboxypeptidase